MKAQKLEVTSLPHPNACFRAVELSNITPFKNEYGHDWLRLSFNVAVNATSWTQCQLTGIKRLPGQRSLDYSLNPSDHYFILEATAEDGYGTGSGPVPPIEFELEFSPRASTGQSNVHHLHFQNGMMGGVWWWLMYRLEIKRNNIVNLELVKRYAYIQGTVETDGE